MSSATSASASSADMPVMITRAEQPHGGEQPVVELGDPLEVERADDGQHEQAALEQQHGRRELEDRLLLGALELRERLAQAAVRLAEAHAALLELAAGDLQRRGHRVERAGERAGLAGALLGRARLRV